MKKAVILFNGAIILLFGSVAHAGPKIIAGPITNPNNAGRVEDFVPIYYPSHSQGGKWNDWNDRTEDPIGLPMNGVVEIVRANVQPLARGDVSLPAVTINPMLIITNDSGSIKLQWP